MKRVLFSWHVLAALVLGLTGCGASFVNLGSQAEPLTDGLKDPASLRAKVVVAPEQRWVSNFDDGNTSVNPKLINASGGSWNAFSYGGNTVNDPIVGDGGAEGTPKSIHIFGNLTNKGDNSYPSFMLVLKPNASGFFDATPFTGISFYYKCPSTDKTLFRSLTVPIAATLPSSAGGTCQDGCYDHYKQDLSGASDWTLTKMAFRDFKRSGWGAPVNPPEFVEHLAEIVDFEWGNNSGNQAGTYAVDYWVDQVEFY